MLMGVGWRGREGLATEFLKDASRREADDAEVDDHIAESVQRPKLIDRDFEFILHSMNASHRDQD